MMTKRIAGILFDLGDTLLDFGKVDVSSLFESGARRAFEYLDSLGHQLPSFTKYHRQQLWAIRWNFLKSRFTRREFNALETLGRLSNKTGQLSEAQAVELAWRWYEPLSRCATVEDGLRETLQRFLDDGLSLGVVSNTFIPGPVLDRHLAAEGLLELLPVRVYSCDVRFRKPSREIFEIALKQTDLQAEETLFVGDSISADIQGANAVGMISVLKDPRQRYTEKKSGAAYHITRIAELADIVAQAG